MSSSDRLAACAQREAERQHALLDPLVATWKEKRRHNGEMYISISNNTGNERESDEIEKSGGALLRPNGAVHTHVSLEAHRSIKRGRQSLAVHTVAGDDNEDSDDCVQLVQEIHEPMQPLRREIPTKPIINKSISHRNNNNNHSRSNKKSSTVLREAVRRRKLAEEDAAFLLFYGVHETPSATILRLIVGKFIYVLDAAMAAERRMRSEWMKIVFDADETSKQYRRFTGPMARAALLPRPVHITVRPLQLAKKQRSANRAYKTNQTTQKPLTSEKEVKRRYMKMPERSAMMNDTNDNIQHSGKQKKAKTTTTPLAKQRPNRLHCSEATVTSDASSFTPRKCRRRYGSIGSPLTEPQHIARHRSPRTSSGVQTLNLALSEPLPPEIHTLGENRSIPIDWSREEATAAIHQSLPVHVDPLMRMTTDELEQHINSVRSEGRICNFERLAEVLSKLMTSPRNYHGIFNTPVDPVALNLPTYTTIVTKPMDLGTIQTRLTKGLYMDMQDFVADVRLVFENAKRFNPATHYIHVDADMLLRDFEEAMKDCHTKRMLSPQHGCLVCRGQTCFLCNQQCLSFAQPHLQCSGSCGTDIRKGSIYYVTRDGTRVWCHKCRNRQVKNNQSNSNSPRDSQGTHHSLSNGLNTGDLRQGFDDPFDSLIKKKCDVGVEPWVKCGECSRWLHQVCGLYNPVFGLYAENPHEYVCPLCRWRRKKAMPSADFPLRTILDAPTEADQKVPDSSCLNIPSCEISDFIQAFLRRELTAIGEGAAAETLHVRVLSFPNERMTMSEGIVKVFRENTTLLTQVCPEMQAKNQQQTLPTHVNFLSRGLYLFQRHEGVDVCLFAIYAQEFGDACELVSNRRSVYIAYLDSVRYLKPASSRTAAYHFIMLAYFDYVRRHGFERVHIWSCPPQKRISYVFWCRPAFQKTPSAEHLRSWYNSLLEKAKARQIVSSWSTMYDRYFTEVSNSALFPPKDEPSASISTRGATSRSVDPTELIWPVEQLPPIFDGDFIPAELERILGRIVARNAKSRRSSPKSVYSIRSMGEEQTAAGESGVGIKEELLSTPQVEVKLHEMFVKCQSAVQRLKHDLLVVDLLVDRSQLHSDMVCRPEALVPAWCGRVPRFFGSRFMFHQLCSYAGYQFDSLRRAKHSTMMVLHHYFNQHVPQVNVFCRNCSLLITHAQFWRCNCCTHFALCDMCYPKISKSHEHPLHYGSTVIR